MLRKPLLTFSAALFLLPNAVSLTCSRQVPVQRFMCESQLSPKLQTSLLDINYPADPFCISVPCQELRVLG
jgi:hypothetical protein